MTLDARAERWAFAASALGMASFLIADESTPLAVIAIVLGATGRSLARSGGGSGAVTMPRWTLHALVIGAVAYAALSAIRKPEDFVSSIGALLCSLQVIRWFDRLGARDLKQMLIMSAFSAVAAALTSNSLVVGVALAAFVPVFVWATSLYQVAIGQDRVRRLLPDAPAAATNPRFVRDGARVAAGATAFGALFAALVFVLLPRNMGADIFGEWSSPPAGSGATMGFTEKVQLGRSGEVGESQEPVLDLQALDSQGRNLGSAQRTFLLRGLVFDSYDPVARAWVRSEAASANRNARIAPAGFQVFVTRSRPGVDAIVQRITLRNKQTDYLFAAGRPVSVSMDRETNLLSGNVDNVLAAPGRAGRVTYTVESQLDYTPAADQALREAMPRLFREGRVRAFTDETLRQAGRTRDPGERFTPDDLAIARLIEKRLRTEFAYSLEMIPPEQGEDPIEMFLYRTKRGHCEYFASAMAAMLRSVGIDARVIGGYRATEYNDIAGQYTVRQSDAHSWVEAQVALGLWVTFDPSPPDGVAAAAQRPGGPIAALRHLYDAAEQVWVSWVVGFDHSARTGLLGVPRGNVNVMASRVESLTRLPASQVLGRMLRAALAGAVVFAAASVVITGVSALLRLRRERRARTGRVTDASAEALAKARRAQARFFERLLDRLERLGAPRPAWRPPLDHVRSLPSRLAPLSEDSLALAGLYYELRFGGRLLTEAELAEASRRLDAIDAAARAIPALTGPRTGRARGASRAGA